VPPDFRSIKAIVLWPTLDTFGIQTSEPRQCRAPGAPRTVYCASQMSRAILGSMAPSDLQYNMAVDTDAQRRPLPPVAPVGRRSLLR
jgi:hypothetical protein